MNKNETEKMNELTTMNTELTNKVSELNTMIDEFKKNPVYELTNKFDASNFGFKSNEIDHDGNKFQIVLKSSDGKGTIETTIETSDMTAKALAGIAGTLTVKNISTIANAWYIAKLKKFAKNNKFSSVGEFIAMNFKDISKDYANSIANTAETFLTEVDGKVKYKYEWCNDVPLSNLSQILGKWNEMKGDEKKFYDKYIKPDEDENILLPIRNQTELKKAIKALNAADGKKAGGRTKKDDTTNKPELTTRAMLAKVIEWFTEKSPYDEAKTDEILKVLNDIDGLMSADDIPNGTITPENKDTENK